MTAVVLHRAQNSCPALLRQDISFFLIRKPGGYGLISMLNKNSACHGFLLQSEKHVVRTYDRSKRIKAFWESNNSSSDGRLRHYMANGDGGFSAWLPSFSFLAPAVALLNSLALVCSYLTAKMASLIGQHLLFPKDFVMQLVTGGNSEFGQLSQQGGLGMALLTTSAIAKDHISPVVGTLKANPTFMSGLLAWAIAQVLKVFTTYFVERRWNFKMILGSGGMPSSHSALCVGLTTSVAVCHGVSDALFPVCLGFSLIVMYDATGVRRHAGKQAEVLNMIVEDLFQGHPVSEKKLKELLGHTPLQVIAGACLGMLVGYWCSTNSSRHLI